MQILSASDLKNRLGSLLDVVEQDRSESVLIKRNNRPVAMVLDAQIAEQAILSACAQGMFTRAVAMQQLGIAWYGDLLQRMYELGIPRPQPSAQDVARMHADANLVLAGLHAGLEANNSSPQCEDSAHPNRR